MKFRRVLAGLVLSGLSLGTNIAAAQPSEYARQWPVSVSEEGAYALQLDESVYRQLSRNDLSDLAAFNADGQTLAFGPMPASYDPPPTAWREAVWFALPATGDSTSAGMNDNLHLHVRRSPSGELSLDASVGGTTATVDAGTMSSLLIDVLAEKHMVEAVSFEPVNEAADFNLQISIEASEDLEHWQTIVASATLAQLHQDGRTLTRKQIEFAALETRYLRVRSLGGQALPVRSMRLELTATGSQRRAPQRQWLAAEFVEREGNAFIYRLPARIPVEQVAVELADDNTLAEMTLTTRDDANAGWQYAGALNAFRLRGAGLELANEPLNISGQRSHYWRIETAIGNQLGKPPTLKFAWRPESWLLLTHGRAPYVIAAGSERARRQDFPLEMLVGQVRSKYGSDWQPPMATLGTMQQAGGDAALRAYNPEQKRTWLLWGVLLLGALAVVVMVVKLMKTPPGE